ncbi:Holliday junction branch migration protein RuvA [Fusibacter paucivorans]|uniref:Holliday junction branch migration complex subunit RuvA n=1 Tax=Fusibacter paucivorans TaxID=76009 RepID=A0ABS5PS76_9FIRM|nr:Holliday junction branch migration protein RuvA [Fusibacter paucivorans]MBS7527722.1 Holliday junction branch migration protein RuvA [Fusibacter paucivorans]
MIDYIKGELVHVDIDHIVVDNRGVGYQILTSKQSQNELMMMDGEIICYTQLIVREDAMLLVGFASKDERAMFQKLTSVSGIGTKVAIGMLSHQDYRQLALMIMKGDVKGITAAPGVGKKTAERLILELKDKVGHFGSETVTEMDADVTDPAISNVYTDALEALISLGYAKHDAEHMLRGIDMTSMTAEGVIKEALKKMMGM